MRFKEIFENKKPIRYKEQGKFKLSEYEISDGLYTNLIYEISENGKILCSTKHYFYAEALFHELLSGKVKSNKIPDELPKKTRLPGWENAIPWKSSLNEINMNIQDIIPLPVINNLPQQRQQKAPLNAQIAGLVIALKRFGLKEVANWITDKYQDATDPGTTVPDYVLAKIPQQTTSQSDFARQSMAARVIANKLGLYDAADYLKHLL